MCPREYAPSKDFIYSDKPSEIDSSMEHTLGDNLLLEKSIPLVDSLPSYQGCEGIPRGRDTITGIKSYGLLVLALLFLGYLFGYGRLFFVRIFKSLTGIRERSNLFDGSDVRISHFSHTLYILGILICTAFGALFMQNTNQPFLLNCSGKAILYSFGCIVLFCILKQILYGIFCAIHLEKSTRKIIFKYTGQDFSIMAILLFLVLIFNEMLLFPIEAIRWILLISWLIIKAMLFLKFASFFSEKSISGFHLILYLCGLEILPFCVLCKSILLIQTLL